MKNNMLFRVFLCALVGLWVNTVFAVPATSSSAMQDKEAYAALADVLENPTQRVRLIRELRRLSADNAATKDAAAPEVHSSDDAQDVKELANSTKQAVASVVSVPAKVFRGAQWLGGVVMSRLDANWSAVMMLFGNNRHALAVLDWTTIRDGVIHLAVLIGLGLVLLYAAFFFLKQLKAKLSAWAVHASRLQPVIRRTLVCMAVWSVDLLFVVLIYFVLNSVAFYFAGERFDNGYYLSRFVEAFLAVELIKVGLRVLLEPNYAILRIARGEDAQAHYWYRRLSMLANVAGYGFIAAVPAVEQLVLPAIGEFFSTILAFVLFVYSVMLVVHNRRPVRNSIMAVMQKTHGALVKMFLILCAKFWHWIVVGYLFMLLVMVLLKALSAIPVILKGTLLTVVYLAIGIWLSTMLMSFSNRKIKLPDDWRHFTSGVAQQINTYIPIILNILHFIVLLVAFFAVLDEWHVVHLIDWIHSSRGQYWLDLAATLFMIVLLAAAVWAAITIFIEHKLSPHTGDGKPTARVETLLSLLRSALAIVILFITIMLLLSEMGVNIAPLIAGAGVIGLAVGFGAQQLVQDIITGIFIQIENAMNTGDVITVAGITGTAEKISIRSVSIRDIMGTYHIVPFSHVSTVSNYMKGYAYHKEEYQIGYNEDIDVAIEQLKAAFQELVSMEEYKHKILDQINVAGVSSLSAFSVDIRVLIKTTPGDQWQVGREFNRLVKIYFDRAGIEIPYPHQTIYFGKLKDEQGQTPPANIHIINPTKTEQNTLSESKINVNHHSADNRKQNT